MATDDAEAMDSPSGGEPFWVVVLELASGDYAASTEEAPNPDEARALANRTVAANEPGPVERVARTTGPFPNHVATEDREERPPGCASCGLVRYCGNHPPTARQTWFERDEDRGDTVLWRCIQCGTGTAYPKGGPGAREGRR